MFSNEKYYVTNHDYLNTGGGCMVSIFTVYDRKLNATRYIVANDEGFNVQTADTIHCAEEFDQEELDKIVLEAHSWSTLTCEPAPWEMLFEDDDWKLYKYCQFEFYKRDCRHCRYQVDMPVEWLSPELYDSLTTECKEWLRAHDEHVKTDGERVYLPQEFSQWLTERDNKRLQALKDFKEWLDSLVGADNPEDDIERCYNHCFTLSFMGKSAELPFYAETYENISELLDSTIKDW